MKTGLLFGSFNPVHTGHLLIASYMANFAGLEKIWFVVSPQNPFKVNDALPDEKLRLQMLQLAIQDDERFEACDFEFGLSRPSYTVNTLQQLREAYPQHEFFPIIGGDNYQSFHHWKDHQHILKQHQVFVYSRPGYEGNSQLAIHPHIKLFDVPLLNISSTFVRDCIRLNKSIRYLVPETVRAFIEQHNLYL